MDPIKDSDILKDVDELLKRREAREEQKKLDAPISKVEAIKADRTPQGTGQLVIGGIPVDVFDIEAMVIKVSPTDMKTLLRYDGVRQIEQVLNNPRLIDSNKVKFNWWIIIIIIIIAAIGGAVILFGPKLLAMFGGLMP